MEYPRVAEYLDMAPMLSGTGNTEADAAFELRIVHFMTGGLDFSANPYWDIVGPSVSARGGRRTVDCGNPEGSVRLAFAATILQGVYAYAVPAPETLAWCRDFCGGRPIVEIGAGRGYWAAMLARSGCTVHAYDSEPPDVAENISFPRGRGHPLTWYPVASISARADRGGTGSDEVMLLCWPPGWGDSMASRSLTEFERAGGRRLIYIGEPPGGRTADDAFFHALRERWRLASQDEEFVSWWNVSDVAQAWVRS